MDDLISRQASIDEWKNDFKGYVNALNIPRDDYKGIMEYIDELPSANMVKVVRCKECMYYAEEFYFTCRAHVSTVKPDDFCSYGERKDNG